MLKVVERKVCPKSTEFCLTSKHAGMGSLQLFDHERKEFNYSKPNKQMLHFNDCKIIRKVMNFIDQPDVFRISL